MTRRPGLTMTEALVAIFITAIGLVGVMSMFPFGAKQMSDALISDRSASHAGAIDGLVRGYWKEKVVEDTSGFGNNEPFWTAMDNPSDQGPHPSNVATPTPTNPLEPSYPVFLDPMGWAGRSNSSASKRWVGDSTGSASGPSFVPRRSMRLVTDLPPPAAFNTPNTQEPSLARRLWSQPDGFSWDEDSRPAATDTRELRYNALAVLQRPVNRDRYNATLKVVVFINRRDGFFPQGSEAVFPNTANPASISLTPGSTAMTISSAADIRKGSWIMDATIDGTVRHANFYRVVSVAENTAGFYDVELHTPVKRVDGGTNAYNAVVVVMAGVADVFDRPALTGNTN
ncbi:hypothetical protein J8F10_24870 [Gemmata sp. G18]|uniref:Type II secretion system protein n=1 Tax=Gemmata palustris TaxID=2822762 RepID=A0ABS5BXM8_9BACT|nr:hypothetical protein [Gemmata palustris]MBP3958494.1 hypothetical protein [Gemmata palustris]